MEQELPKIGDWGFVTGSRLIYQELWDKNFPQGWFGRVIRIDKNNTIVLRCYWKGDHPHLRTSLKYFKLWKNNYTNAGNVKTK